MSEAVHRLKRGDVVYHCDTGEYGVVKWRNPNIDDYIVEFTENGSDETYTMTFSRNQLLTKAQAVAAKLLGELEEPEYDGSLNPMYAPEVDNRKTAQKFFQMRKGMKY